MEKKLTDGQIAAVNFGLFVFYGVVSYLTNNPILFGLIFIGHFITGIVIAIALKRSMWALSALVILLIGVASCVKLPWHIQ